MKETYKKFLFSKGYFVADKENADAEDAIGTMLLLGKAFNISVHGQIVLCQPDFVTLAANELGLKVPEPFYGGFPESVKKLSIGEILFDRIFNYVKTYGFGDFSEQHSILEEAIERKALSEHTAVKNFTVLTELEAKKYIVDSVENMLASTRPLSDSQIKIVLDCYKDYTTNLHSIASKNVAMTMLLDAFENEKEETYGADIASNLSVSDVPKFVEILNYKHYNNKDVKKLNLKNRDRKTITAIIHYLFNQEEMDNSSFVIATCMTKRKIWKGILHHIHFNPVTKLERVFVQAMFKSDVNLSYLSIFEENMGNGEPILATEVLKKYGGNALILRNLDYILSRCKTEDEVLKVVNLGFDTKNLVVLFQLLAEYSTRSSISAPRTFTFTKFNMSKSHTESTEEANHRGTVLSKDTNELVVRAINERLSNLLKGKLGKVYIDEKVKKYTLPLQENTSNQGYGTLPTGSHVQTDNKSLRLFTYWEKVNDIDLSAMGLDESGKRVAEFSWRTLFDANSGIAFSGDCTSGYNGGSEYIDIDVDKFRKNHPEIRYLVLFDNVFSGVPFSSCTCRAGYMLREDLSAGKVFEPKTVKTSFAITGNSTFAALFTFDVVTNEIIWLNKNISRNSIVAGATNSEASIVKYFRLVDTLSLDRFFSLLATEVVSDPKEAEVIVTDDERMLDSIKSEDLVSKKVIKTSDTELILALMNGKEIQIH